MIKALVNNFLVYFIKSKNRKQFKPLDISLELKHVQNLKTLPNRTDLLFVLPKNAIVAELGVDQGEFSKLILKNCQPKKLHLIDAWHSERYNDDLMLSVKKTFENDVTVEINRGLSTDVLKTFQDSYFDWIYIDTDHSYYTTAAELSLAKNKVKKGGIISGHDYVTGYFDKAVKYGVIEAVHEFCINHNWEIIYLTAETNSHLSFAIKEISALN